MDRKYTFNLTQDRFDVLVMDAFSRRDASRLTRDRLISRVRQGKLDRYLLKAVPGLENLPDDLSRRAAVNIIDFHFEPLVLRHLTIEHLATYAKDLEKMLRMESVTSIDTGAPLWIDTVHHACVFSALAQFTIHLAKEYRYDKAILLHQGERPEPRLALMANVVKHASGLEPTFVRLTGNWFLSLSKITTPGTIVWYLADMPPQDAGSGAQRDRRTAGIRLAAPPDIEVTLATLSGSHTLARRLGACHVVLEYPANDRVRVRRFDPENPVACCPLEDWVFWPALKAA